MSDVQRLAVLSAHTSPLVQPGDGDAGGMNVYVRELVSSLAQAGVASTVYVRAWRDGLPADVEIEPGFRVVHIPAGPTDLAKEKLPEVMDAFADGVLAHLLTNPVDAVHANYWLSGVAGHRIKHELDLPLLATFHTLARVKAEGGDGEPERRVEAETSVIGCADAICANSEVEAAQLLELYGADPARIEIVPPGVDHAFFSPGDKGGARAALGLDLGDHPVLLFVGRVQPLKGLDVAVATLAQMTDHPDAVLVAVGGPSGEGADAHLAQVRRDAERLGVADRIRWVDPQPHHLLSSYYRAADVTIVPSRSESFGLVALESAACGTPVVASDVGGLRTLVDHGGTGFRVESRQPGQWAGWVERILDSPELAADLARAGVTKAQGYTWSTTAARLRRLYADLSAREPVACVGR